MRKTESFEGAARALVDLLAQIKPEQWAMPGLGVWSIRSLAGHAGRSILTVEEYLAAAAPALATILDAESYFLSMPGADTEVASVGHDAVAQRGVDAGIALGEDPARSVQDAMERTLILLAGESGNRIVRVLGNRSIRLDEYLRTRVFELVVHSLDLSRATGVAANVPEAAVEDSAALAARIAARSGRGETLLLAVTGRTQLPDGFSVV